LLVGSVAVADFGENCNRHYQRGLLSMRLHMPLAACAARQKHCGSPVRDVNSLACYAI
jgi:hypothetical protein